MMIFGSPAQGIMFAGLSAAIAMLGSKWTRIDDPWTLAKKKSVNMLRATLADKS